MLCVVCLVAAGAACRKVSPPEPAFQLYRFDDNLASAASVVAPGLPTSARMAEPVVWKGFHTADDVTWILLRGRVGLRNGQLILRGEGGTPVILSPKENPIDWGLYEAVRIRMMSEGGAEVKIKIGPDEFKQRLAPAGQYQVYRFDVTIKAPKGSRPLAVMPTDSQVHLAAIDFIELVPRRTHFREAAGRQFIGKQDDYRNTLYAHAPSSITYEVNVPQGARISFAAGIAEKNMPVRFRILAAGAELYSRTVADPEVWEEAEADLAGYAGRNVKLVFETSSDQRGAVGLWANPMMTGGVARSRPNVLVYLVCTLRPDHTSLHGYSRDTTPFLRKLGAAGVVFDDAHAQATWTKASVPSLMTSLYSFTHGIVRDNDTIPAGATTLAERFRDAGYVTASLLTNPFPGRLSGLERGFDHLIEYPVVHRVRTDAEDRGTDSAALNRVLLPWLERHRRKPFFLYAHATDPHAPYRPPPAFEEKFADPSETPLFDRDYARLRDERMYGGGATISRADCIAKGIDPDRFIQRAIDRYDAEIAHNDHSIGQLADKLNELGILDNTLLIVVSDHGEEFWEHGWTAHGHSLYQELTHALFLMWNPKLLPAPRRGAEPVQLVDLMPTVLDLLDIEPSGIMQGQSLVPLLKGKPFERQGMVMSSRFAHPNARVSGFVPEYRTGTFALIRPDWKFIFRDQPGKAGLNVIELYDRLADRQDARNLAAQFPDITGALKRDLDQWIEAQKQVQKLLGPGGKSKLDPQTLERLRSLGYVGGKSE